LVIAVQAHLRTPLVLPLDAGEATLDRVGGKGASLAKLALAGLPVPAGFHLTTEAYHRFVAANNLHADIVDIVSEVSANDTAGLEHAAAAIYTLFEQGTIPDSIVTAINQAYLDLGKDEPAVAVRSSATAEDLPELSFAGQQETFLNVRGGEALLEAVRRCWASLWTTRAIGYRYRMGIDQQAVAMGIVVQMMVPADISGVLFTANPTTGDRTELVINASFGLGEAIVAGQVTPDTYVLDKATLKPKEVVLGAKQVMIVPDGQGTTTIAVPEARRDEQALPAPILRELAALGVHVEQLFGGVPQDIEWAVAGGCCWLLQSRPITNLPPEPPRGVRWEPPTPGSSWIRRQVTENMPEPLSPLFDDLYLGAGLDHMMDRMFAELDIPPEIGNMIGRPIFATVNGYAYMRADLKLRWTIIPTLVRTYVKMIGRLFRAAVPWWRDEILPSYRATIERWKRADPATTPDEQLLRGVRELAIADAAYWYACAMVIGAAKITDMLLDRFLAIAAPGRELTSGLFLRGFPSKTLEAEAELESIAGRIRDSDTLRPLALATPADHLREALVSTPEGHETLEAIQDYLDRYGHQVYNLDFVEPTQGEDPLPVLINLKALVQQPKRDARARREELARERDRQVTKTARSFDPVRRYLFRPLVGWAQRFGPYREQALFYMGAGWPVLRRLALELGQRLTNAGSLEAPDDVFYLESAELEAAIAARAANTARPDLARLARERRELREARKRLHPPAAVPPSFRFKFGKLDASVFETQRRNPAGDATLSGFAVSPGQVTAPASVIRSPADFNKMVPGTILVCPTTTPAWTPLFAQARGLVTDIGGILAHGSIVAREYGIPAVMGTGNATQRIVSGQKIQVDGDAGTVTLVDPSSDGAILQDVSA
jgi:pyruvate,water dikinase